MSKTEIKKSVLSISENGLEKPVSNKRLEVLKTYKIYIGGQFPRTESGRFYVAKDSSGKQLANVCLSSRKDFRDAVVAAYRGGNRRVDRTGENIATTGVASRRAARRWERNRRGRDVTLCGGTRFESKSFRTLDPGKETNRTVTLTECANPREPAPAAMTVPSIASPLPRARPFTSFKAFSLPNRAPRNSRTIVCQPGRSFCIAKSFMITFSLRKLVYAST